MRRFSAPRNPISTTSHCSAPLSTIAAVLGGIGIIPCAALGGFVIGILETLSTAIGLSSYRDAIVYGVLIVILLLRPAGILGKNVKEKV